MGGSWAEKLTAWVWRKGELGASAEPFGVPLTTRAPRYRRSTFRASLNRHQLC